MSFSPVPISSASASLDPSKHVNYTLGMILGVDDLNQDFVYHANREQWIVRDLIGYGTACGMQVSKDESDINKGPSLTVSPGVALNPAGQFIRVTPAQCAYLNAWLNSDKVKATVATNLDEGKSTTVFIKLCYRSCLTDSVPVPGEACRTEDSGDLLVPSRVQDDFSLDFSFDSIDQNEETGLRAFVAWLRLVKIAAPGSDLNVFLTALRTAAGQKFVNAPDASLAMDADTIYDYLRSAFLVWTTEFRPTLRGVDADCVTPSTQDCVMLSALTFQVTGSEQTGWAVNGSVTIDESARPYLLHLRILQEWLLTASSKPLVPDDSLFVTEMTYGQASTAGVSDHYARADHTHGTPPAITLPSPDDTALKTEKSFSQDSDPGKSDHFARADHTHGTPDMGAVPSPDDNRLVAETTFSQSANAGQSTSFARADHTHGTPPDPIPPHVANAAAHKLDGDVTGALNRTFIDLIQGQPLKAANPADGQYLKYVKDHWEPSAGPAGTQGNCVLRPFNAPDYFIMAAGVVQIDSAKPFAAMITSYNNLDVSAFNRGKFGIEITLKFDGYDPGRKYIVKLTPWPDRDTMPYISWVIDTKEGIKVAVGSMQTGFDGQAVGSLMVEISEFN